MTDLAKIGRIVERFLLEAPTRRELALSRTVTRLTRDLREAFDDQRDAFLRRFLRLPETTPPGWSPAFAEAAIETRPAFEDALRLAYRRGIELGFRSVVFDLTGESMRRSRSREATFGTVDVELMFDVDSPEAKAYLEEHAAERVTNINATTRDGIARIVRDGVAAGSAPKEIASLIHARYGEIGQARALRIATHEASEAYGFGQLEVGRKLENHGIVMTKLWLTAGDSRVDPVCADNEGAGTIAFTSSFPSGAGGPPEHVGCRCDLAIKPEVLA